MDAPVSLVPSPTGRPASFRRRLLLRGATGALLPALSRHLLGEPLALPSLDTWWCGEAAAWQAVQPELSHKVLRSTFPRGGRTSQIHEPGHAHINRDPEACPCG